MSDEPGNKTSGIETRDARDAEARWLLSHAITRESRIEWTNRRDAWLGRPLSYPEHATAQKAVDQRPNVFTHGLTLSKADVDDICGTGNLYGGKVLLACGCIDICTNQRDHKPPAQSEPEQR